MDDNDMSQMPGAFDARPIQPPSPPSAITKTPKRRFVGRRTAQAQATPDANTSTLEETTALTKPRKSRIINQIPDSILNDPAINEAIALLPSNYNFEVHKTIHRIRSLSSTRIALQMPEGLLMFATVLSDIITSLCPGTETLIMGDVTYGACCVDDFTATALGCDLLIHYAHSCLIPVSRTKIETLYIFVDISIDTAHLIATLTRNISPGKTIAMSSTIQFASTLHQIKSSLENEGIRVLIPGIAPLSKGEILGCTAPTMSQDTQVNTLIYLGDGRFHLEALLIANPSLPLLRYDPYSRTLTRESYDHDTMLSQRKKAITTARHATKWGLILGALGRQGNPHTLTLIENKLKAKDIPYVNLLLSEIFPGKLALMNEVECWVQIACPRLSIDWGYAFERPLLTPYEALLVLNEGEDNLSSRISTNGEYSNSGSVTGTEQTKDTRKVKSWTEVGHYPMDYYATNGLGRVTEKWAMEGSEIEIKG